MNGSRTHSLSQASERDQPATEGGAVRVPASSTGSHDADAAHAATPLRVAITAHQRLLADMAAAALTGVGVDTTTLEWPSAGSGQGVQRRLVSFRPHVCLSLHDLDHPAAARVAELLLRESRFPWVVLASGEPGPSWGAALQAGAHAVLPGRLSIAELVTRLRHAAARSEVMEAGQRQEVVLAWSRASERGRVLAAQVASLTPREMSVLEHLYEGERVGTIADGDGVAEATVRSQVKSMLRKLGVSSQIAAVAVYREVRDAGPDAGSVAGSETVEEAGELPGARARDHA